MFYWASKRPMLALQRVMGPVREILKRDVSNYNSYVKILT